MQRKLLLQRVARYVATFQSEVWLSKNQGVPSILRARADSDWAGDGEAP